MRAMTERVIPAMVPMAKSNQNTSPGPSERNGSSPRTVERIVSIIGRTYHTKFIHIHIKYGSPHHPPNQASSLGSIAFH